MRLGICKIIIDSDYSLCYNNRRKEKQKKRLEYSPIRVFFLHLIYFFWCLHVFCLISIHAPQYEVRHTTVFYIEIEFVISIHAPFVGCDAIQLLWLPNSLNFNPHTHRGVRLLTSWSTFSFVTVFQSTHPSWGATLHCKEVIPLVFSISIHAPIVGCDVVCNKADITLTIISIHAPIVGCDTAL